MGKILLTQAQKLEHRYAQLLKCIGQRVEMTMCSRGITQKDMAEEMHMSHSTIRKITDGEEVRISTTDFLKFLDMAGLKLVDRSKDAIQKEAER